MRTVLTIAAVLAGLTGWSAAQQITDYDAMLSPHRAESRQFCDAAPECVRMRVMVDANGNVVKAGQSK